MPAVYYKFTAPTISDGNLLQDINYLGDVIHYRSSLHLPLSNDASLNFNSILCVTSIPITSYEKYLILLKSKSFISYDFSINTATSSYLSFVPSPEFLLQFFGIDQIITITDQNISGFTIGDITSIYSAYSKLKQNSQQLSIINSYIDNSLGVFKSNFFELNKENILDYNLKIYKNSKYSFFNIITFISTVASDYALDSALLLEYYKNLTAYATSPITSVNPFGIKIHNQFLLDTNTKK